MNKFAVISVVVLLICLPVAFADLYGCSVESGIINQEGVANIDIDVNGTYELYEVWSVISDSGCGQGPSFKDGNLPLMHDFFDEQPYEETNYRLCVKLAEKDDIGDAYNTKYCNAIVNYDGPYSERPVNDSGHGEAGNETVVDDVESEDTDGAEEETGREIPPEDDEDEGGSMLPWLLGGAGLLGLVGLMKAMRNRGDDNSDRDSDGGQGGSTDTNPEGNLPVRDVSDALEEAVTGGSEIPTPDKKDMDKPLDRTPAKKVIDEIKKDPSKSLNEESVDNAEEYIPTEDDLKVDNVINNEVKEEISKWKDEFEEDFKKKAPGQVVCELQGGNPVLKYKSGDETIVLKGVDTVEWVFNCDDSLCENPCDKGENLCSGNEQGSEPEETIEVSGDVPEPTVPVPETISPCTSSGGCGGRATDFITGAATGNEEDEWHYLHNIGGSGPMKVGMSFPEGTTVIEVDDLGSNTLYYRYPDGRIFKFDPSVTFPKSEQITNGFSDTNSVTWSDPSKMSRDDFADQVRYIAAKSWIDDNVRVIKPDGKGGVRTSEWIDPNQDDDSKPRRQQKAFLDLKRAMGPENTPSLDDEGSELRDEEEILPVKPEYKPEPKEGSSDEETKDIVDNEEEIKKGDLATCGTGCCKVAFGIMKDVKKYPKLIDTCSGFKGKNEGESVVGQIKETNKGCCARVEDKLKKDVKRVSRDCQTNYERAKLLCNQVRPGSLESTNKTINELFTQCRDSCKTANKECRDNTNGCSENAFKNTEKWLIPNEIKKNTPNVPYNEVLGEVDGETTANEWKKKPGCFVAMDFKKFDFYHFYSMGDGIPGQLQKINFLNSPALDGVQGRFFGNGGIVGPESNFLIGPRKLNPEIMAHRIRHGGSENPLRLSTLNYEGNLGNYEREVVQKALATQLNQGNQYYIQALKDKKIPDESLMAYLRQNAKSFPNALRNLKAAQRTAEEQVQNKAAPRSPPSIS